jgi:penicillin V acylase-like amidase (Ntn superfamily)
MRYGRLQPEENSCQLILKPKRRKNMSEIKEKIKTIKVILMCVLSVSMLFLNTSTVNACTGIILTAADNSVVYGRSMEWGAFDLNSRVTIIPRGYEFVGLTPDGYTGKKWTQGRYHHYCTRCCALYFNTVCDY